MSDPEKVNEVKVSIISEVYEVEIMELKYRSSFQMTRGSKCNQNILLTHKSQILFVKKLLVVSRSVTQLYTLHSSTLYRSTFSWFDTFLRNLSGLI